MSLFLLDSSATRMYSVIDTGVPQRRRRFRLFRLHHQSFKFRKRRNHGTSGDHVLFVLHFLCLSMTMPDTNDAPSPAAAAAAPFPAEDKAGGSGGEKQPPAASEAGDGATSNNGGDAGADTAGSPKPSGTSDGGEGAPPPGPSAGAGAPDQPQKKRRQERQMRPEDLDDEHECADGSGEDGEDKEARLVPGTFQRASDEQLQKRRILKVRRPGAGGGGGGGAAAVAPPAAETAAVAPAEAPQEDEPEDKPEPAAVPAPAPAPAPAAKSNPFAAVSLVAGANKDNETEEEKEEGTAAPAPAPAAFGSAAGFKGFATAASSGGGFGSAASGTTATSGGSTFGSGTGFSGFGTKVASAGFGTAGGSSAGFGGSFAAKSTSGGFGSAAAAATPDASKEGGGDEGTEEEEEEVKSPSAANGSTSPVAAAAAAASSSTSPAPAVLLGDKIEHVETGEEGEDLLFMVRAKLFKWGAVTASKSEGRDGGVGAEHSVAPTSNAFGGEEKKAGDDDGDAADGDQPAKMDWKEQGVGPLRLLRSEVDGVHSYRLVHRQEDEKKEGGRVTGIRVILNLRLPEGVCTVFRKADKFVKLSVFERNEGGDEEAPQMADFVFKVKTSDMADELQKMLVEAAGVKLME